MRRNRSLARRQSIRGRRPSGIHLGIESLEDRVLLTVESVISATPAADSFVTTAPTDFTINFSRPYDPQSVQATDLTVNGITADSFVFTDINTITFHYDSTPVTIPGQQSMAIAAGAIVAEAGTVITEFTEVPPKPVDGVTLDGLTFFFNVGPPSQDATFGSPGLGNTLNTTPPALEGNAAGRLTLLFKTPVSSLKFPVVLSTTETVPNAATVQLVDATGNVISVNPVSTSVPPGFTYSEGLFTYTGPTPVKFARVTFNSAAAARFVIDDIIRTSSTAVSSNDDLLAPFNATFYDNIIPVPTVIPVTTFADVTDPKDGLMSLREAITFAAKLPGDNTIVLPHEIGGIEGTYAVNASLGINDTTGKLTIESSGGIATIDGQKQHRVFSVLLGSQAAFNGLTITGGGGSLASQGGGISNSGTLQIIDCTVSDNSTNLSRGSGNLNYGGGIFNLGRLQIIGSTVSGNVSDVGGGIYNGKGGTLEITDSTLTRNFGYFYGSGVANGNGSRGSTTFVGGTVTITRSTLSDNSAKPAGFRGGGVFNGFDGTLFITDSVLSGNWAQQGGGVFNQALQVNSQWQTGSVTITGSTLSGNSAIGNFGGGGGGGVKNDGVMTIADSTLSGNSGGSGGGVSNGDPSSNPSATLTITNSTLSDNSADNAAGGGVFNWGLITVTGSTISGNSSGGSQAGSYYGQFDGGGVFNNHAAVITDTTFIGNSAPAGSGGGVANGNYFLGSNNSGFQFGGGFYVPSPAPLPITLTITGCTFSGNSAGHEAPNWYAFDGGAIADYAFSRDGDLTITDSTFSGNSAEFGVGGGIFSSGGRSSGAMIARNVIQQNLGEGLYVVRPNYAYGPITVSGNTITGNSKAGVLLLANGTSVVDNTISLNGGPGVAVIDGEFYFGYYYGYGESAHDSIRGNSIYGNAGLPIDLGNDGPTAYDDLDADDGPNHLQNSPVLNLALSDGTSARVSGLLHSTPNTSFLIDFYATPPDAPGQSYLGAATVMTDGAGNATYLVDFPAPVGWTIAATATTLDISGGETSEFSDAVTVAPPAAVQSVVVNDGSAQRSMVNRLQVTFDQIVTIDPGAFELIGKGNNSVALNVSTSLVAGQTVAVITFAGKEVVGGSLSDGTYTLTVRADKVRDLLGHQLDGDGNGLSGGNRVDEFFRLFGDADGDHDVDNLDFDRFKDTRFVNVGDPGYLWFFDFDGDGAITPKDQKELLNRRAASRA